MAYTKQTWADLPSKTTPINAERLTHIEDGIYSAAQTADTAASTAGTAAANVGIVSGRVETLTERVNSLDTAVSNKVDKVAGKGLSTNDYDDTDKGKVDSLGTASTKNSTSVVTQSTDLVESGAVKDIVGWGNKNLLNCDLPTQTIRGVTLTNNNGVLTLNGTNDNTANSDFPIGVYQSEDAIISSGTYKCIISDTNKNVQMVMGYNGTTLGYVSTSGTITAPYGFSVAIIRVPKGATVNNVVVKPMVTKDLSAIYADFEPYHASVEEYCASKQDVMDTVGWCSTVLDKGVIAGANVNGDGTINISTFSVAYFKVEANKKYTVSNCNDFTDRNLVFGYYVDVPVINAVSYNNSRTVIERGTATSRTVTAPIDGYIAIRMNDAANNIRFEEGEVVTQSVEDKKCDNSVIGTVEGANASKAWSVGEHFISGGQFKEVTQPISSGGEINSSNTVNKPIADLLDVIDITSDILNGALPSGITFGSSSKIFKIGHLIIGNIVVKNSNGFSADNQTNISIKSMYSPTTSINSYCYMADDEWSTVTDKDMGYFYVGSNVLGFKKLDSTKTLTVAKVSFVYVV